MLRSLLLKVSLVLVLVLSVLAQGAVADEAGPADELPDELRTGVVRFKLLVGEPLTALALNPRPETRDQRLLHAQALADIGLHEAARRELEELASANNAVSAKAGLELIRLALEMGDRESAQHWLDQTLPRLSGDNLAEARFRQAELLRQQGDLAGAATVLGKMGDSTWTGLGYFNLAAAYAARETQPSRPLVALRVAAATVGGRDSPANAELLDRTHLAGGLIAMRAKDYVKAISFFDKVRLDSFQAPRALYLHGLAHSRQDNVRAALQSWHRARKFPLAFPGTPEAHIAMGHAYDEAGSLGQAAEAYLAAQSAFEKALVVLRDLDQRIQEEGAYAALIQASRQNDVEWFLADTQAVTAPRLAWLMHFMETSAAQHAVRRVAELDLMAQRLRQRQEDLALFEESLSTRVASARAATTGSETSQAGRLQGRVERLKDRAEALRQRFERAVAERQMDNLVSGQLADRFRALETLEAAARYHNSPAHLERIRRLRGLTLWNAQENFQRHRQAMETSLQAVTAQLDRAAARSDAFQDRLRSVPERFGEHLRKIERASEELADQLARIQALRERSDAALTEQVRAFLAGQREHLALLLDRSEQEIAHLYEYMAVSRLEADRRRPEGTP